MYEDANDLTVLQDLLDQSLARSSEHLHSIITPGRAVPAGVLAEQLTGMRTLALSTVSAAGRPRISGVDGHLLRGRWIFTTSGSSVKAADLRSRPAVSAAYLEGDSFGVFTHGDAEFLDDAPSRPGLGGRPPDPSLRRVARHLGTGHCLRPDQPALDGRLQRRPGRLTGAGHGPLPSSPLG